jgi:predicted GIY-YIG superfamily endonuclease
MLAFLFPIFHFAGCRARDLCVNFFGNPRKETGERWRRMKDKLIDSKKIDYRKFSIKSIQSFYLDKIRIKLIYVDDIFCLMKRGSIERLLTITNRRYNTIKFTYEVEDQDVLCFLDAEIKRVANTLEFNIYRKPTMTSRYITNDSHHCVQHKSAAFNCMINRLCSTTMSSANKLEELRKIKTIARINGYDEKFVDRIYEKHVKKQNLRQLTTLTPQTSDEQLRRAPITFYPGITNKLQNIFKKHKIKIVYSNKGKLCDLLGNPKDKPESLEKSGIYQIKCEGCNAQYIGQTRRSTATRFNEHLRHIKYNHPNLSSVASHVLKHINQPNTQHAINMDSISLLKEVHKPNQLDAYESIFIRKRQKENVELLNEDDGNVNSRLFDLIF